MKAQSFTSPKNKSKEVVEASVSEEEEKEKKVF
jgi:hypothetical protein